MGQGGKRGAYVAAVQKYLQSEAGQSTAPAIAERMLRLQPELAGQNDVSESALAILRQGLERLAAKDARPRRIFLAIAIPD